MDTIGQNKATMQEKQLFYLQPGNLEKSANATDRAVRVMQMQAWLGR
jgi:hypothetical protein